MKNRNEETPPDVRIIQTKGEGLVISLRAGTSAAVEKLVRKFLGDAREENAADERRRLVCLLRNLLQIGARIEVHRASIAGGGAMDRAS